MPSLEKPCLLLPHGSERSTVYLCVPVDPSLATKSSVIETLIEFDGFVEMPEGVSCDDFEAWSAIATRDPSKLSLDELSFALQVGGRLSAQNTTQVAEALAAKLAAAAWTSAADKESMMQAVLPLSKDMQQLVFRKLLPEEEIIPPKLLSWPVPLQQAFADLWASPSRDFVAPLFDIYRDHPPAEVLSFLRLLTCTDPSLPGISILDIDCHIVTPEAASLLSSALLHHPRLRQLCMPRLSWSPQHPSPPAAAVFRTLPQLTAITSLTLSAPSLPLSPSSPAASEAAREAVQAMAAAISALPSLTEFALCSLPKTPQVSSAAAPTHTPKRRRIATCMGPCGPPAAPPSLDPVFAALSTAPALADLTLCVPASTLQQLLAFLHDGSSDFFHSLTTLMFDISHSSDGVGKEAAGRLAACAALLGTASLAQLKSFEYVDTSPAGSADIGSLQSIYAATAAHSALQDVGICLGPKTFPDSERHTRPGVRVQDNAGVYLNAGGGAAPRHFGVYVRVAPQMTPGIAAALSTGLWGHDEPALDWVQVRVQDRGYSNCGGLKGLDHVGPMLRSLATLTHLTGLSFEVELRPSEFGSHKRDLCASFLAEPLQTMSCLTYLSIDIDVVSAEHRDMLMERLAVMPQLQHLRVGAFENSSVAEFEACFVSLTALTRFEVHTRPVTADLVRAFARVVASMPHLCHAELRSCDGTSTNAAASEEQYAAVDWFQGLLDLPCRGYYEFWCQNQLTPEGEGRAVLQQLAQRGARLGEHFRGQMKPDSAVLGQMLRLDFRRESTAVEQ